MNKISIKLKITLWYMGLMTGLVILFLLIIFYMSENIIHSYEYGRLKSTVESSFREISIIDGEIIVENDMETKIDTIQLSVYNKNLGFVYGNNPLNFEYDDTFSDKKNIKTVKHQYEKWYVYESKKTYEGYGEVWVRGVMSAVGASQAMETVITISLVGFPFFLIFAGIIGYIITKNAFIPIEKIRSAAEKINEGDDLSQRINLGKGNDEIYTLANTFDTMFDRLQNSFEREIQFTSDVSHELRTPISVISTQSEYGLKYLDINNETKETFESILEETKKMSGLVSNLLMLARMDKGYQKLNIESTNLSELAEIAIETQKISAKKKNICIKEKIDENIYADTDESMIMRVFINLISNAVCYGKENGNIIIEIFSENEKVICKVIDDGIGIAKEHIHKIWNRFYQIDTSRSGDNSGLGLSMVKWIIEAHKGKIGVESEPDKGTVFTFELPLHFSEKVEEIL